jgi:methionyl-tRNA formyltransferase
MVMHPGVCPEYRNSHGCFWALANDDPGKVGMTLLRVDRGIDTGPVYGYFSYDFDAARESHVVIQWRMVFDNLDSLAGKLEQIHRGEAEPIRTEGRCSALWGQPWLSRYVRYRSHAARLKRMPA